VNKDTYSKALDNIYDITQGAERLAEIQAAIHRGEVD
jgi:hypothetical protein